MLWQTADVGRPTAAASSGPVTTANGVVFGCSLDPHGHMYALDGATGSHPVELRQRRLVPVGRRHRGRPVVLGIGLLLFGTPNNKLYSFGLPG